jgi:hypothetical protein
MKKLLTLIFILAILPLVSLCQNTDERITMSAVNDFSLNLREGKAPNRLPYTPYHIEKEWNALAGDDLNFAFHMASAEGVFPGRQGVYTVTLNTLTERDGECAYNVYVNDKPVGLCQKNPPTNEFCAPARLQWTDVEIPANAKIRVESNSYSNLRRPEMNFFEYARGRWTGIDFKTEKAGMNTSRVSLNPEIFGECNTIGSSSAKAEMKYDIPAQAYYLVAYGSGMKDNNDTFGYLNRRADGDFILEAGVRLLGMAGSKSSNGGIMVRHSLEPGAAFVACFVQNDNVVKLKYRAASGEKVKEISFKVTGGEMIQIEKKGDIYTVSSAKFGEAYERNTVQIPGIKESSVIGFFVCSGSEEEKEAAAFSNIRLFDK